VGLLLLALALQLGLVLGYWQWTTALLRGQPWMLASGRQNVVYGLKNTTERSESGYWGYRDKAVYSWLLQSMVSKNCAAV
jgi:hypothetical protein